MIETTTALAREARQIQRVVKHWRFPDGIRATATEVTFGEDWSGRPAAWIKIPVERGYDNPPDAWISKVQRAIQGLRTDLLARDRGYFPYIDLKPLA